MGTGLIGQLDSAADIERTLVVLIDQIRNGTWQRPASQTVTRYSRQAQSAQLAKLMSELSECSAAADASRT
jgi:hypothetical protein